MSLDPRPLRRFERGAPRALLVRLTDPREGDLTPLLGGLTDFAWVDFAVSDWGRDLSPWPAPPVFGREPFGGYARETLDLLLNEALPALPPLPTVLGGYSLAGLFALWAQYETGAFAGIAAASPSVWYPGWDAYADARALRGPVYLSLGRREPHARNRQMATVGEAISRQADRCPEPSALEWNPGGHFDDPAGRTARAFAWALGKVCPSVGTPFLASAVTPHDHID